MTNEQARKAAEAVPDELYDLASQAYRDLMTAWALDNAPEEVKADALQRAAIAAGITDGDGRPFPPLKVSALLN